MRPIALLFLLSPSLHGVIALIAHTSASSTNTTTVTTSSIDTTGANFCALIVTQNNPASGSLTDSKSNSYTALTAQAPQGNIRMYYVHNATVGTGHTFTWTASGSQLPSIAVACFSGVKTSSSFDVENGAGPGMAAPTIATGSVSPAGDNELIVSGQIDVGLVATTITPDSSLTLIETSRVIGGTHYGFGLAYIIQTTAGAVNCTWSTSPSDSNNMGAVIAAFFPSTAGLSRHRSTILE